MRVIKEDRAVTLRQGRHSFGSVGFFVCKIKEIIVSALVGYCDNYMKNALKNL